MPPCFFLTSHSIPMYCDAGVFLFLKSCNFYPNQLCTFFKQIVNAGGVPDEGIFRPVPPRFPAFVHSPIHTAVFPGGPRKMYAVRRNFKLQM